MLELLNDIDFPRNIRATDMNSHLILCAGAKSSASTWLFNVVAEIMRAREAAEMSSYIRPETPESHRGEIVRQFYADSPEVFPVFDSVSDLLVIQTQRPSSALCTYAIDMNAPIVMTIREPRDSIASLMKRFGYNFASAFRAVTEGDARVLQLFRRGRPLVLRFEDRFYEREATIAAVAGFLHVDLPAQLVHQIHSALTRDEVRRKIETLQESGAFGGAADRESHDPQTRWRPGHVGDITIGQHAEFLSHDEQLQVLQATAGYCAQFGYPTEPTDI
ncbi:MAG TPA: hypothetical protein VGF97_06505 [Rhizomicrobium sp.]|jgi:hypothetical protein